MLQSTYTFVQIKNLISRNYVLMQYTKINRRNLTHSLLSELTPPSPSPNWNNCVLQYLRLPKRVRSDLCCVCWVWINLFDILSCSYVSLLFRDCIQASFWLKLEKWLFLCVWVYEGTSCHVRAHCSDWTNSIMNIY